MESSPFLPAFPPRRAFFFIFISLLLYGPSPSFAGYLAAYTSIESRPTTEALVYVQNVQRLLKGTSDRRLSCKNRSAQHQVLCKSLITRKKFTSFLDRPEFFRMGWNAETLKVSSVCIQESSTTCKELLELKQQFFRHPKK